MRLRLLGDANLLDWKIQLMLDPAIIDYIRQKEQERLREERPQIELPVELPIDRPQQEERSTVIVIELL
jgi:hypothetical protein